MIEQLLQDRYYAPGESSWKHIADRVTRYLYREERALDQLDVYNALKNKEFLPSSPVLMNAGRDVPMLHSCFVLPLADDLESILKSFRDTMMIQKFGGGVGLDFTPIRKANSPIASTGGKASGPVSFMKMWNTGMDVIKQAGKRQGALMGVLHIEHPDVADFIAAKTMEGDLTNFNISVAITDKFINDWANHSEETYPSGFTAYELMDMIAAGIWTNGEPGIMFIDHVNKLNKYDEPITCMNPCGEIPIPPYGACCLGSVNLASCLIESGPDYTFNWVKLDTLTRLGIEFLNRVVDKGVYILPEVQAFQSKYRPIGLGVMGLAEVLASLGIPYDSQPARLMAERIMYRMRKEAWVLKHKYGNTTALSIAPTGTLAMFAGTSYSIEPYFALKYTKKVEAGDFEVNEPILDRTIDRWGKDKALHILKTATEIAPADHIRMQAAVQRYVDNSVSKTINMQPDTTIKDIKHYIHLAYTYDLKGLTMYRSGSRDKEVIECINGSCSL